MSDSDGTPPAEDFLKAFQLGPSWARGAKSEEKKFKEYEVADRGGDRRGRGGRGERTDRRGGAGDQRGGERRGGGFRGDRRGGGGRDFRGGGRRERGGGRDGRRGRWEDREERREEFVRPAEGVRVELVPAREALELIHKEIQQFARVYSLFDIARVILSDRERYRVRFVKTSEKAPPMLACSHDDSVWLTREEALAHMWKAPWRSEYYDEETIEVDPPKGNFQHVARCGFSGEWLGPTNYHGYQKALRSLHRERFSHIPFERYASRVRTEHGEEAVEAWLETMKVHTRFRPAGSESDEEWMTDRGEVERHFAAHGFDKAFRKVNKAETSGKVPAKHLSPALLESLKSASFHTRKHPAMMIPPVCRMLESLHLPVFKRSGKLFTGPSRPHPLPDDITLAERPAAIVEWLSQRGRAKLADLWKDLLPEGQDAPCKLWLADLFWLLTQGNVLLMSDDTLILPGARPAPAKKSILVRKAVERMTKRRLKRARGIERIWRHRLKMRQLRRTGDGDMEEEEE